MQRMRPLIPAAIACMLLASCMSYGPSAATPQGRISRNAGTYSLLSPEHRQLVASGKICEGMSKDAVKIAMGRPSRVMEESRHGKMRERWDYMRERAVPTSRVGISAGYGHGYPYRYGGYGSCYPMHQDVAYVPYRVATVWFVNGRVDSWEQLQ
jgi:outer membrane protein assembly factor BamE (lipoprotein component of BamABCDE complex)